MWIIINENNKIEQTISGNYGLNVAGNQRLLKIADSELIAKIKTAYEYELVFENDILSDVLITKTIDEWLVEQPELEQPPTIEEYMVDLDFRLSNIELGLQEGGEIR